MPSDLDRRKVAALSLMGAGIVGVAIDVFSGAGAGGESSWIGDLLFLSASSCWAFFTVLLRQWKVAPWDATIGVAVASMLIYLPFYLLFLPKAVSLASWSEIAMQGIYQGVLVVFVAMILYTRAVADIGASPVSLIMATVPAISALLAVALLGEAVDAATATGLAAVSLGAMLGALPPRRAKKAS